MLPIKVLSAVRPFTDAGMENLIKLQSSFNMTAIVVHHRWAKRGKYLEARPATCYCITESLPKDSVRVVVA